MNTDGMRPMSDEVRVPTPGGWIAPKGVLPAWNWTPPTGIAPRPDRMPLWVRAWFRTPLVDRYAHAWMWHRGGWDVEPFDGPDASGVREPRRPGPPSPSRRSGSGSGSARELRRVY